MIICRNPEANYASGFFFTFIDYSTAMPYNISMNESEYLIQMRKSTGLSQQKFADIFHIPVTTLRDWEQGRRTPPSYVPEMMQIILDYRKSTNKPGAGADIAL